jgi:voltage-gated potassium channel
MLYRPTRTTPRPVTVRHFLAAAAASLVVLLASTVAFMSVMDQSALDALYRSVNTITTAGEVSPPKHTGGRLVTLLVLMSGVSIFLYVVALTVELVVGGVVSGTWQRRRMESRIARLNGHHIICGYGRVGSRVASELARAGHEFVVVDSGAAALERASEDGVAFVDGSGEEDEVLEEAGIARAGGLVACVDDDAANTFIVLTAKGLRPDLRVVARASSASAAAKLRRAGADEVVSPYTIAGERIAGLLDASARKTA